MSRDWNNSYPKLTLTRSMSEDVTHILADASG